MKVLAKFVCNSVTPKDGDQTLMQASAVTSGSEENKSLSRWTPSGNLDLWISNETEAKNFFIQGKEFYLTFSEEI